MIRVIWLTRAEDKMKSFLIRLWKEEDGQSVVDYALLATLVALSSVAIMGSLATSIVNAFTSSGDSLSISAGS